MALKEKVYSPGARSKKLASRLPPYIDPGLIAAAFHAVLVADAFGIVEVDAFVADDEAILVVGEGVGFLRRKPAQIKKFGGVFALGG